MRERAFKFQAEVVECENGYAVKMGKKVFLLTEDPRDALPMFLQEKFEESLKDFEREIDRE